jgi:hypothetical protein
MRRLLFCKIMQDVCVHDFYFLHNQRLVRSSTFPSIQECISAMKMMAYGLMLMHVTNITRSNKT